MFDVIKKLLFARQLSFEEGEIKLLGQNVVMTPVTIFMELYNYLKKNEPKRYGDILYNITKEVARKYDIVLKEKYGMNPYKLAEWDVNTLGLAGLGKGELAKFDLKNKECIVRVVNSPIARQLKPAKIPIDFVIAGYIGGSGIVVFNSEKIICKEVTCEAMGHRYCEFHVFEKK